MSKVDWLDRLTFREIELVNEVGQVICGGSCDLLCHIYQKEKSCSKSMYLMVEFPRFHADEIDYSVVYFEEVHSVVTMVTNKFSNQCLCH